MVNVDYYSSVGYAVELLSQSEYHRQHRTGDYLRSEVLPALWCGQTRFYVTQEGLPSAMVTWAWLSESVETQVHASGRVLMGREWNCGDRLFINDWITPYHNVRDVLHDMTHNIFPDKVATSLRRNANGSVRRINRWTGVNLRQVSKEVMA